MKNIIQLDSDELWIEVQNNNRKAFELLYNENVMLLVNQAYKILRDESRAKDIVQEVFISLYIKRHQLPSDLHVRGYLCNAVKYKVSNLLRDDMSRKRMYPEFIRKSQQEEMQFVHDYERKEIRMQIGSCIENLPHKCKSAFKLNFYHHLSYKDVATQMGISVKTVEKHISKAWSLLRSDLKRRIDI